MPIHLRILPKFLRRRKVTPPSQLQMPVIPSPRRRNLQGRVEPHRDVRGRRHEESRVLRESVLLVEAVPRS
jgi:hypothetical protein